MNERNNGMDKEILRKNPFRVPEGYFDGMEDRLMARIAAEEAEPVRTGRPVWRILKPALTLAATFAIIFGMGYGVLSLTHTLDRGTGTTAGDEYALAEETLIRPLSVIDYYQAAVPAKETDEIDPEILVSYLSSALSVADLADIYAQSQ